MSQNPLVELEQLFKSGAVAKGAYIEQMYALHQNLFSYSEFIRSRNVEKITITHEDVLVTTKTGVTLVCNPEDWRIISIEILNFGDFEQAETQLLLSFAEADSVIVDIGANIGWYSILLGGKAAKGRVIAFEPIPSTIGFLRKNLALNGTTNVELHEHGLSDEEKELVFFFHPHLSGATSAQNLLDNADAIEVRAQVKRMDDVLASEPRIDLLKCDIEGAEIFALRGGMETIERTKPVLFIEMLRKWTAKFGYQPNDIIALLGTIGYQCFAVEEGGHLSRFDRMEEFTVATNFIFLHRTKHAGLESRYLR
jgi:FkbM family methyltransferase